MQTTILEEAIEQLKDQLNRFEWTTEENQEIEAIREQFRSTYNQQKIATLTENDYFSGDGRRGGCMAYDLEWGTKKLGSIQGGSKYKFGYETDFPKIKSLIQKVTSLDSQNSYQAEGMFSEDLEEIIKLSKEINGFKTGRTVIPKLLSIYYPEVFLPIFNDQDHFLSKLLSSGLDTENTGLALYLEYNYKLLKVKEKLKEKTNRTFTNFEFTKLLYQTFPKEQSARRDNPTNNNEKLEEQSFEALEVQHYQSLLHRNFKNLFANLKYFDEEEQNSKNGQYNTQVIGIMDFLAVDQEGNFVIIEIKREATDQTIGQVLRYMGWTQEELCKDGQKVSGIIVAEKKDIRLDFALKVIPNVKFKKLTLSVKLE